MKILLFIFTLFTAIVNAQSVNLIIKDYTDNLSIDDADIYFKNSKKSYISDLDGKVEVDLSNVHPTDELIVSKKEYQNIKILVSSLPSNLTIRLEKVPEVELKEAYVTNLKVHDVLRKIIENHEKKFNVDKYYFLVDLTQDYKIDTVYENFINLNLQIKFDQGKVKAKTSGIVKNKVNRGTSPVKLSFDYSDYFKHLYVLEGIKSMYDNVLNNKYTSTNLAYTEYSGKKMYEIQLESSNGDKNNLLIDRESFAVVEYLLSLKNTINTNKNTPLIRDGIISFKYRPYLDGWVLKESEVKFKMNLQQKDKEDMQIDFLYKMNTTNFDVKPFQYFDKRIDLRENLHDRF